MRARPKQRKGKDKLHAKPPKKRALHATWITREEEELEQEKLRRKQQRKSRNKGNLTVNYDALGDDRGQIASNPYGQKTRVVVKQKYYKMFSNK